MRCVLVDVDGTLVRKPSTEVMFAGFLLRHGVLGTRQLAGALGFFMRWTPTLRTRTPQQNKAYLVGLTRSRIAELAEQFVGEVIEPRLRPDIVERINSHRRNGDRIALLTGTPDFLAEPIARRIGAERWQATVCDQQRGRFTAGPPLEHPFGHAKTDYARRLCRSMGATLDESIAYADSGHDIPMLSQCATPVAVYPDVKLTRRATALNWEIIGKEQAGRFASPRTRTSPRRQ